MTMYRRSFLKKAAAGLTAVSAGLTLAGFPAWAQSSKRPSFLVLTFEDISPRLGCYGDPVAKTPILDKLAARGYAFTNMMASSRVCAPARCT